MRPYNVNIVADYVIQRLNADEDMNLVNLKLQKLVYYLQAWFLGINGERFLDCSFEAWVHGPVCRELYDRFKGSKTLYSFISMEDVQDKNSASCIESQDKDFINYILDNYAGFSGVELEAMTHKEMPWKEARNGIAPMLACEKVISEDTMREYYGERWKRIQGENS